MKFVSLSNKLQSVIFVLCGVALGFFFGRCFPVRNSHAADLADAYGLDVKYERGRALALSNLTTAVYWRKGLNAELAKYLDEEMLPAGLVFFSLNKNDRASSDYYAWRLKMYYLENSLEVPAKIRAMLDAVPLERPKYYGKIAEEGEAEPTGAGRALLQNPPPETPAPR
jgi:hypothetical protein